MGPICRLWTIIEKTVTQENSEEREDQISLEDIIRLIEKSVMLLGQVNNKIVYFRCLNILNMSLNSKSEAKGIVNTYVPLLSTNSTELFGRQFRKQDNAKALKETLEMFREVAKTKRNPFQQGFQRETNNHQGEVLETTTGFPSVNIFERSNNKDGREIQQAKPPINQMVRLQKQVANTFCNISVELLPLEKLENVHPLVKEMFPEELKQNVPLGRISHFVQSWKKLTKDQEIL